MTSQSRDTGEQFTSGCDNGEQGSLWGDHGEQVIIGSERQGEELVPPIPSHLENEVVDKPQVIAESSPTECPVSVVSGFLSTGVRVFYLVGVSPFLCCRWHP